MQELQSISSRSQGWTTVSCKSIVTLFTIINFSALSVVSILAPGRISPPVPQMGHVNGWTWPLFSPLWSSLPFLFPPHPGRVIWHLMASTGGPGGVSTRSSAHFLRAMLSSPNAGPRYLAVPTVRGPLFAPALRPRSRIRTLYPALPTDFWSPRLKLLVKALSTRSSQIPWASPPPPHRHGPNRSGHSSRGATRGRYTRMPVGGPRIPSKHRRCSVPKVLTKAEGLCSSWQTHRTGVLISPLSASKSLRPYES